MSDPQVAKLLLTYQEAAEALGISERKLWELQDSGEIPTVRIGRSVRFAVASLQAWIDAQQKGGEG